MKPIVYCKSSIRSKAVAAILYKTFQVNVAFIMKTNIITGRFSFNSYLVRACFFLINRSVKVETYPIRNYVENVTVIIKFINIKIWLESYFLLSSNSFSLLLNRFHISNTYSWSMFLFHETWAHASEAHSISWKPTSGKCSYFMHLKNTRKPLSLKWEHSKT